MHVKADLSKHNARDFYLVTSVDYDQKQVEIQKFCGNQLKAKRYLVNMDEIYLASPQVSQDRVSPENEHIGIPLYKFSRDIEHQHIPVNDPEIALPSRRSTRISKSEKEEEGDAILYYYTIVIRIR